MKGPRLAPNQGLAGTLSGNYDVPHSEKPREFLGFVIRRRGQGVDSLVPNRWRHAFKHPALNLRHEKPVPDFGRSQATNKENFSFSSQPFFRRGLATTRPL
jgi:hypothetical protein